MPSPCISPSKAPHTAPSGGRQRRAWRPIAPPPGPTRHARGAAPAAAIAALFAATLLVTHPLGAQSGSRSIEVEGGTLQLAIPPDHCDLDPAQARDRALIAGLDRLPQGTVGSRRILRRFAPCRDLERWRAGGTAALPDLHVVAALTLAKPPEDRSAWLESLRSGKPSATGEALVASWNRTAPDLAGAADEARVSATTVLDFDRDGRALYLAALARTPIAGRPAALISIDSLTMVGRQPLQISAFTAWEGEGRSLLWLAEEQRELVDRLLGANGEERRRVARAERAPAAERRGPDERQHRDLLTRNAGWIAVGLILGGALLVAAGMIGTRVLRRHTA